MSITTLTSREFNQDVGRAKRSAEAGPVIITDRGCPKHVLMTYDDYRRLTHTEMSLAEALQGPDEFDFDFDPPRLSDRPRSADLDD